MNGPAPTGFTLNEHDAGVADFSAGHAAFTAVGDTTMPNCAESAAGKVGHGCVIVTFTVDLSTTATLFTFADRYPVGCVLLRGHDRVSSHAGTPAMTPDSSWLKWNSTASAS